METARRLGGPSQRPLPEPRMRCADELKMPQDERLTIRCAHGERTASVVCGHMVRPTDRVLGFVESSILRKLLLVTKLVQGEEWSVFAD